MRFKRPVMDQKCKKQYVVYHVTKGAPRVYHTLLHHLHGLIITASSKLLQNWCMHLVHVFFSPYED